MRLPDFVIAGSPRSGTSTLRAVLAKHPDVMMPVRKELHFFTLNLDRGLDWYGRYFEAARPDQVCGEGTPAYLFHRSAVERMATTLPDAKIILLLRDPVDRAYSHFILNQWKGVEGLDFEHALAAEDVRLRADPWASGYAYVGSGMYGPLVSRLYGHYPRDRVLVLWFDDLRRDVTDVARRTLAFLGVTGDLPQTEPERHNHHGPVRSVRFSAVARKLPGPLCRRVRAWNTRSGNYPPMRDDTRARLADRFETSNAELAELVGSAVPWQRERPRRRE